MDDTSLRPARRAAQLPRSGIRKIMALAAGVDDVMHLEVGEPDFNTPDHVVDAARRAAPDFGRYTPNAGLLSLRETIVVKLAERNGIRAGVDEVTVTTGGVGAVFGALAAVCDAGDKVLVPDPGWPNYLGMTGVLGLEAVPYPLRAVDDFAPDLDRLRAMLHEPGTRAMVINNPSNPTGAVWDRAVVAALVDEAERAGVFLISDEVYEDIVFEGSHVSPASLTEAGHVLTAFSVSKTYAMTGWRVGYLVATAALSEAVGALQESTVSCVNGVAQRAAEAAIGGPQECVATMRAAYQARRDTAVELLRAEQMLVTVPHGAFYVLADVSRATDDSQAFAHGAVRSHGVAVAPGSTFGAEAQSMVRLSLAASTDTIRTGIERLSQAVADFPVGGTQP